MVGKQKVTKPKPAYHSDVIPFATEMARVGATDAQLARALGIGMRTLYDWQARHPAFASALKVGKGEADEKVVRSLFQRACGYTFVQEEWFLVNKSLKRKYVRKHIPPDVTAGIFWLKNRMRSEFRENGNLAGEVSNPTTVANVEVQLLAKLFGVIERHSDTKAETRAIEARPELR